MQLNAGALYASGTEEGSYGFELGAGFYHKHSTSSMSSALTLNYFGISTINEEGEDFEMEAGYDVIALDYRLYFPIAADKLEIYAEGLAGIANTEAMANIGTVDLSAQEWGFAFGFGGGVQWNIIQNFGVNLGYSYMLFDEPSARGVGLGEDGLSLLRFNATLRF